MWWWDRLAVRILPQTRWECLSNWSVFIDELWYVWYVYLSILSCPVPIDIHTNSSFFSIHLIFQWKCILTLWYLDVNAQGVSSYFYKELNCFCEQYRTKPTHNNTMGHVIHIVYTLCIVFNPDSIKSKFYFQGIICLLKSNLTKHKGCLKGFKSVSANYNVKQFLGHTLWI